MKPVNYSKNTEMLKFFPFQIAAFRETFEEGGILLASTSKLNKEKIGAWRKMIYNKPEKLLEVITADATSRLELNRLKYIAEWITPSKYPKRFATKFFLYVQKDTEAFESKEDGQEIVDMEWVEPKSFLEDYNNEPGKYILFPPQYHILSTFASQFPSYESIQKWQGLLPGPYNSLKKFPISDTNQPGIHISSTTPWVTPFLPIKKSETFVEGQKHELFTLPGDSVQTPHKFTTCLDSNLPGALSIRSITLESNFNVIDLEGSINPFSVPNGDTSSKL